MQVFHTAGVPPSIGNSSLPIIGWTRNSRVALTNSVKANNGSSGNDYLRSAMFAGVTFRGSFYRLGSLIATNGPFQQPDCTLTWKISLPLFSSRVESGRSVRGWPHPITTNSKVEIQ